MIIFPQFDIRGLLNSLEPILLPLPTWGCREKGGCRVTNRPSQIHESCVLYPLIMILLNCVALGPWHNACTLWEHMNPLSNMESSSGAYSIFLPLSPKFSRPTSICMALQHLETSLLNTIVSCEKGLGGVEIWQ